MIDRDGKDVLGVAQWWVCALAILIISAMAPAQEATVDYRLPVKTIADGRLSVTVGKYSGVVPIYTSVEWDKPQPNVTRALLFLHGRLRNADEYYETALKAVKTGGPAGEGTAVFVPQFLARRDATAHHLPHDVIHWPLSEWMGGDDASAEMRVSSFDVIDALLSRLSDRTIFPKLTTVVIAGHSGGGQLVQRYAAVAKADAPLIAAGVKIRWIVSNPSTYLYFTADRPTADGKFAPFDASQCQLFNLWKYGPDHPPRYVTESAAELEKAYMGRDIVYLLGGADNDPKLEALDKTCGAEAQGDSHLSRGLNFVHYLQFLHPEITQKLLVVPGVGHDAEKIFCSEMGQSALFDTPLAK